MITPVGISQSDYIAAIRAGNPTHVKMVFPVQGVTLVDSDIALDGGMNISTQLNPDTDLTLGKAISSEFDVTLVNRGSVRELFWTEEFTFSMGVDVSNWVCLPANGLKKRSLWRQYNSLPTTGCSCLNVKQTGSSAGSRLMKTIRRLYGRYTRLCAITAMA